MESWRNISALFDHQRLKEEENNLIKEENESDLRRTGTVKLKKKKNNPIKEEEDKFRSQMKTRNLI